MSRLGCDPSPQRICSALPVNAWVGASTVPAGVWRQRQMQAVFYGLTDAGVWSQLDLLYVIAAHNAQAAALNFKSPSTFALTAVNSPTFAANRGYAGNGSTSYLDTGWSPANNGVNFQAANAHVSAWDNTAAGQGSKIYMGASPDGSTKLIRMIPAFGAAFFGNINETGVVDSQPNSSTDGIFVISRTASTAKSLYRNGVQLGVTVVTPSTSRPTENLFLLGGNQGGSVSSPTSDQFSTFSAGAGLSGAAVAALYAVLGTYRSAVGVP